MKRGVRNLGIIDISMKLHHTTPEWPGDTPFSYEKTWTIEQSGSVNVGKVVMSTHIGTHIDAPFHFQEDGQTVTDLPLEQYIRNVQVIECTTDIRLTDRNLELLSEDIVNGVIFKTCAWKDRSAFPEAVPKIDDSVPVLLKQKGITLIGIDFPSVDDLSSKSLPVHHALHKNGISILENVVMDHVEEGLYTLIALPLPIEGADGSPVRAVLIKKELL